MGGAVQGGPHRDLGHKHNKKIRENKGNKANKAYREKNRQPRETEMIVN